MGRQTTIYDHYKFLTKEELDRLNLTNLIGTNVLRAYMHGFLINYKSESHNSLGWVANSELVRANRVGSFVYWFAQLREEIRQNSRTKSTSRNQRRESKGDTCELKNDVVAWKWEEPEQEWTKSIEERGRR